VVENALNHPPRGEPGGDCVSRKGSEQADSEYPDLCLVPKVSRWEYASLLGLKHVELMSLFGKPFMSRFGISRSQNVQVH
jgi:hypothetical protein